jgi:hypothetical protein
MIEPLHYIFIVVDGRRAGGSLGLEMRDFAQLFIDYGLHRSPTTSTAADRPRW